MKNKTDLMIRVKFKATVNGKTIEGVEEEASWFLFDQRGGVYSSAPFKRPELCNDQYDEIIPLIKIKDNYMSVGDIESCFDDFREINKFMDERKKEPPKGDTNEP